ncbi:MAG: YifB family Mg chelatase-like AAA ATPase [Candidatus Shapirobacteria bacterium]
MLTKVLSAAHFGLKTIPIEVEVNIAKKGFPGFNIIGLPNKAVEEAKERVKTALANCGFDFPQAKVIVNLAPADIPKEGSCYDLPIALGILACMGEVVLPQERCFLFGELSLDATLRHTRGAFLLAVAAKERGVKNLFLPCDSANEAVVVKGINVYPVKSLQDLIFHFKKMVLIKRLKFSSPEVILEEAKAEFDLSEIMGQEQAKRALEIAAAGGHNLFLQGPPGAGKTMLARALPGILPGLNEEESLEVTKIYSVTGNIPPGGSLITARPFRVSHHTTSRVGLIGGGSQPRPGEISLAHHGVLFLDELPEFPRSVLESLRQPLEDGVVNVSRAAGSAQFPAQFMLIAAANPCPCGFLGDLKKVCRCSPRQINRYQSKLSGPLMDRIDLHLNVPAVKVEKLISDRKESNNLEKSLAVRKRVASARGVQNKRFVKIKGLFVNANMKNKQVNEFCPLSLGVQRLLKSAVANYRLSARAYFRLIKISRTIADLAGDKEITEAHLAESLQYRMRIEV